MDHKLAKLLLENANIRGWDKLDSNQQQVLADTLVFLEDGYHSLDNYYLMFDILIGSLTNG